MIVADTIKKEEDCHDDGKNKKTELSNKTSTGEKMQDRVFGVLLVATFTAAVYKFGFAATTTVVDQHSQTEFKGFDYSFEEMRNLMLVMVAIGISDWVLRRIFWPYLYANCKEKEDDLLRIFKTEKAANQAFKIVLYSFMVGYGYFLFGFSQADFVPKELLGGKGSSKDSIWKGFPYFPPGEIEKFRSIGTLHVGYSMYSMLALIYQHLLIQRRADFMEVLLHHFCTCLILFIGYACDTNRVGLVILLAHNWSDITVTMVKCSSEMQFNSVFIFSGVLNIILWFWTRIYTLAALIYVGYITMPMEEILGRLKYETDRERFLRVIWMSRILIGVIYLLQWYWFVLMLQLGYKVLSKKSTKKNGDEVKQGDKVPDNMRLLSQVQEGGGLLIQQKDYLLAIKQSRLGCPKKHTIII